MLASNKATCRVIRGADGVQEGKQGTFHQAGISAQTAGSERLCLHVLTISPGARARPHLHEAHETALYILSGVGVMWYGEGLSERVVTRAGDYLFIPANMPHVPANLSLTDPCVAVAARTDANDQESVKQAVARGLVPCSCPIVKPTRMNRGQALALQPDRATANFHCKLLQYSERTEPALGQIKLTNAVIVGTNLHRLIDPAVLRDTNPSAC